MTIHPDFEELFRLLEENSVEYMIVGGYAVAFHGHPRFTKDIDVFYEVTDDNVTRLRSALLAFGFRVVISSEIADIFRNNSANIGLLPIVVTPEQHWQLLQMDGLEITVDLVNEAILLPDDRVYRFSVDDFARHCLLRGMDRLDFLLAEEDSISAHEETLP